MSSEEVQAALIEDSWTTKKGGLEKVMTKIEKELRNVQWDPFLRRGGEIEGVNEEDDEVKAFRKAYGQQTTALILEKKRELEEHNSSGGYPTKVTTDRTTRGGAGAWAAWLVGWLINRVAGWLTNAHAHPHHSCSPPPMGRSCRCPRRSPPSSPRPSPRGQTKRLGAGPRAAAAAAAGRRARSRAAAAAGGGEPEEE